MILESHPNILNHWCNTLSNIIPNISTQINCAAAQRKLSTFIQYKKHDCVATLPVFSKSLLSMNWLYDHWRASNIQWHGNCAPTCSSTWHMLSSPSKTSYFDKKFQKSISIEIKTKYCSLSVPLNWTSFSLKMEFQKHSRTNHILVAVVLV